MPIIRSIALTYSQQKQYSVVSFLVRDLVADNVSRHRMIAIPVANNLSRVANKLSRSDFLFALNLSRKISCL